MPQRQLRTAVSSAMGTKEKQQFTGSEHGIWRQKVCGNETEWELCLAQADDVRHPIHEHFMRRKLWKYVEIPNSRSSRIGASLTFVCPRTESTIAYMASNGKRVRARLTLHASTLRREAAKMVPDFQHCLDNGLTTCMKRG